MIRLVEALNYRCLRYVSQPLDSFHVLVGPNASGKTTFLDVIAFLGALVSDGLDAAVSERTRNFHDLLWQRQGDAFELAVEAQVPEDRRRNLSDAFDAIRYEVRIGINFDTKEVEIVEERALLKHLKLPRQKQLDLFPIEPQVPDSIFQPSRKGTQRILTKAPGGNDNFYSEVREDSGGKGWMPSIRLGPRKSTLGNLLEDETRFPVATWFRHFLTTGVQQFVLNSMVIRKASPPGQPRGFKPDGSNLPWVIENLRKKSPERFRQWIAHLQTALSEIHDIQTVERPDDRHRYLKIIYDNSLEVPSWMTSDGTLRLLALTLPAYLPDIKGMYLIEEPENGIHPLAVETAYQALSSVYEAQVLLATHSPVILSEARPDQVLCFSKAPSGATDIVRGSEHPRLREWQGQPDLSILFASGVLA